jgi:hypothetical protein
MRFREKWMDARVTVRVAAIAFSSEVDAGSREENASKRNHRASVLFPSEPTL